MKHKVVIYIKNGHIEHIMASGDTEVAIIEKTQQMEAIAVVEPDYIFEVGTAFQAYMGKARKFLQKIKF